MLKPVTRIAAACALIFSQSSPASTLQEVLRQSFTNDPELLEAQANVDAANTEIKIAKSGHLPVVSLTASQVLAQKHRYESNERPRGINPGLQGRLNLYSFGGTDARVRYSEHKHDYFHHKFYETQETVGQTIGKLYLSALRAKENIMAAQSNLERHHQIINDLQIITKYDKGRQSELDQALARRLRVQAYLADQTRSMELYLSRLGKYTQKRLNPAALSDPFSGENASSIVKRYQTFDLGQQPSYQAQQAERSSVLAELDVNKSARYPAIDLIAAASRDNKEIYLNFNWDFFSPTANYQVEKSAQTLVAAEAKSDQILRDVAERSRSAEVDMRQSLNRVNIAAQQIAAQQKVIKAYELQFKIARRTLIDVLDSYSDLWNIEAEIVSAQNDFRDAALDYLSSQSAIARFAGLSQDRRSPERPVRRRFRDHLPETFLPPSLQERFDKIDFDAIGEEFSHLGDQLNYLKDKTKATLDKIDNRQPENTSNSATEPSLDPALAYPVIVDESTLSDSNQPYVPSSKAAAKAKVAAAKKAQKATKPVASIPVPQHHLNANENKGFNTQNLLSQVNALYGAPSVSETEPRPPINEVQAMPDKVLNYDEIINHSSDTSVSGSLKNDNTSTLPNKTLTYDEIVNDAPVAIDTKETHNINVDSGSLKTHHTSTSPSKTLTDDEIVNHAPVAPKAAKVVVPNKKLPLSGSLKTPDNASKKTTPTAKPQPSRAKPVAPNSDKTKTKTSKPAPTPHASQPVIKKKIKSTTPPESSQNNPAVKLVELPEYGVILDKSPRKAAPHLPKVAPKIAPKEKIKDGAKKSVKSVSKQASAENALPQSLSFSANVPYEMNDFMQPESRVS